MAISNRAALLVGFPLVGVAVWQFTVASDAQRQVGGLRQQLASRQIADLETARHGCSERAQRYFTTLGYDESKMNDGTSTTFQNHYSVHLHRCLMTLESTSFKSANSVTTKTLIDADEHATFGNYAWVASATKKYWEQPPMQCTMSPPDKPEATCRTTDEYDAFVKDMLAS